LGTYHLILNGDADVVFVKDGTAELEKVHLMNSLSRDVSTIPENPGEKD
jgi:hypothetical protein